MKKELNINISLLVLLIIFLQVIVTDNIIYFIGMEYIYANIIALAVNFIIIGGLIKKKVIKIENQYTKWDIVFYVILITTCVLSIGFADKMWDTYSYHIYLQENPFQDKIYEDYFPGRTLTTYVYPIADRIFYIFRAVAGYRLGTLPSYFILLVMFYEIKKFIKFLVPDIGERFLSIISIVPICTFIILQQIGTYYIDNFSIVCLLEFSYIVMVHGTRIFEHKLWLYYLALAAGIATCIKFTNAIFLIGLILYLLIINIKCIKLVRWYDYIFLLAVFCLPMLPYCVDAIIQTGSPFFPYYNKIFHSEFFAHENWLDLRFGPDNFWQFLCWPVYILFHPAEAYDLQHGLTDFAFASGYVVSLVYFIIGIYDAVKKAGKIDKRKWFLAAVLIYDYLVWERFVLGYTRYAGIIPVLGMIFVVCLLWEGIIKNNKMKKIGCMAAISISILIAVIEYCGYCAPRYYACYFMPAIAKRLNEEDLPLKIYQSFAMLGRDRDKLSYDIDGIWGVVRDDSMAPQLLSVDDRIVYLEYGFKTGETEKSQQIYWDNILNNHIYVPLYGDLIYEKLALLDENHFELVEIADTLDDVPFIQGNQTLYVVQVAYNAQHINGNEELFAELIRGDGGRCE